MSVTSEAAVWPWAEANQGLIGAVALISALCASVIVFWLERSGDRRRAQAASRSKRAAAGLLLGNALVLCDLADERRERLGLGANAEGSSATGVELLRELGPVISLCRELLARSFDDPPLMFALAEVETCLADFSLQWTRLRDLQIFTYGPELIERNRSVLRDQKSVLDRPRP